MTKASDYSTLDRPEVVSFLFHPRPEISGPGESADYEDIRIPVDNETEIGARFYNSAINAPTILFFHGNGEIVQDYDDMAPLYNRAGINFFPVDYRGYGTSSGSPSVSSMMADCHHIFKYVKNRLHGNGYTGKTIVMGRSLGSASALELAKSYPDEIDALVIESGFAYSIPLMKLLGINTDDLGIEEDRLFLNLEKIRYFSRPTLIIHAEFDHIIPFSDGRALFEASPSQKKSLLRIRQADHNTLFYYGMHEYLSAVQKIALNS